MEQTIETQKPFPARLVRLLVLIMTYYNRRKKEPFLERLRQYHGLDPKIWLEMYYGVEDRRSEDWERFLKRLEIVRAIEAIEAIETRRRKYRCMPDVFRSICRLKIVENIDRFTTDQLLEMYVRCPLSGSLRGPIARAVKVRAEKATFNELHRIYLFLESHPSGRRYRDEIEVGEYEDVLKRHMRDRMHVVARTADQLITVHRINPVYYRDIAERLYALRKGRKKSSPT